VIDTLRRQFLADPLLSEQFRPMADFFAGNRLGQYSTTHLRADLDVGATTPRRGEDRLGQDIANPETQPTVPQIFPSEPGEAFVSCA